ncbi:MAG: nucleotidyltransferase domain-containing protein [Phycisphaerae bacterium]|nr:nucleotidyltransferase domain-containing protein [Phycisphaerae bacterium]
MRQRLWNELRAARYEEAVAELTALHESGEDFDAHLVLAAVRLQHEAAQPIPDTWASEWQANGLTELVTIAAHLFKGQWRSAVDEYQKRKDAFRQTKDDGGSAALAAWCATRAALELGDSTLAAGIASEALDCGYRSPVLLVEALRVQLEHAFLPCPDTLVVDLSLWVDDGHTSFMSPAWAAIAEGLSAWLNHRDGASTQVQQYLNKAGTDLQPYPFDLAELLPFFERIQHPVAQAYAASILPRSRGSYYTCRYVFHGDPAFSEANGLLDQLLSDNPSSPGLHLCKAQLALKHKQYSQALASALSVREIDATNIKAVRIAFQGATRSGNLPQAIELAKDLVLLSSDHAAAYEFAYREFTAIGRQEDIVSIAEFWCGQEWDTKENARLPLDVSAVKQFHQRGRHDALVELLNRRAEQLGEEQLASLLAREEVRNVLAELGTLQGLNVAARFACARASESIKDIEAASETLAAMALDETISAEERTGAKWRNKIVQAHASLLRNMDDAECLRDFLGVCAQADAALAIPAVRALLDRLGQEGRLLDARGVIETLVSKADSETILTFCAEWLDTKLHDAAAGLECLRPHLDAISESTTWRCRCRLLSKCGDSEAWIAAASEGQGRFPDTKALFVIEEGLAKAAIEPATAIDLLHSGLLSEPTDNRGLNGFLPLAKRFDRHHEAIEVLQKTIAKVPTSTGCRAWLAALLDASGSDERALLEHLYYLVHRDTGYGKKERDTSRKHMPRVRERLLTARQAEDEYLDSFAKAHRQRVSAAIRSVPLLADNVVAAVFAQLETDDSADNNSEEQSKEDTHTATQLGLILVVDSHHLAKPEQTRLASVATEALTVRGYSELVRIHASAEIWHELRRSTRGLLEGILAGVPALDSSFLECLRAVDSHREMVLEKFKEYVACYVVAGSFVRGTARPSSDMDVWIVINDTDVKRMSRQDLFKKIKTIVDEQAVEARQRWASNRQIHVQTYLLSDFWDKLRESSPILTSFLRDGVPLYDNGFFNTWTVLLDEGKLQATREALDRQIRTLRDVRERGRKAINDVLGGLVNTIKRTAIGPLEVVLEAMGLPTGDYRQVVEITKRELVAERELFSPDDLVIAEQAVDMCKAYEAGRLPDAEKVCALFRQTEELSDKCQRVYQKVLFERDLDLVRSWAERIRQSVQGEDAVSEHGVPPDESTMLKRFVERVDDVVAHVDDPLSPLRTAILAAEVASIKRWEWLLEERAAR